MECDIKLDIEDCKLPDLVISKSEILTESDGASKSAVNSGNSNCRGVKQNYVGVKNGTTIGTSKPEGIMMRIEKKFLCELCNYKCQYKKDLKIHLNEHKETLHCPFCIFQTKHKNSLMGHMKIHPDPNSKDIFACNKCEFVTNFRLNYKKHMLIHKEVVWFKCAHCVYQTQFKRHLKTHMKTHKSPSELDIFKCDICGYQMKHESSIKRHVSLHSMVDKQSYSSAIIPTSVKTDNE